MAITVKPALQAQEIWASNANRVNKQAPSESKIKSGWVYGEKPPHNEFNWWWNLVGQMLVHIQQHGTPAWDDTTPYVKGAITWHNNIPWKSKTATNIGNVPDEALGYWTALIGIDDFPGLIAPYIPYVPKIEELNGKKLLYVVSWDIGNSFLHLDQVTVNTHTNP